LLQCFTIMFKSLAKIFIIVFICSFFWHAKSDLRVEKKRWFSSNLDACSWLLSARVVDRRFLIEHEAWLSNFSDNQRSSKRMSWISFFDFFLDFDEVVAHVRKEWYSAHLKIVRSLLSRRALIMFEKTCWYQKIRRMISETMIWLESVCELRFVRLFQKFDLKLLLLFSKKDVNLAIIAKLQKEQKMKKKKVYVNFMKI
jgi:hypothetical protein